MQSGTMERPLTALERYHWFLMHSLRIIGILGRVWAVIIGVSNLIPYDGNSVRSALLVIALCAVMFVISYYLTRIAKWALQRQREQLAISD